MPREKAGYRDALERLNELFPDRELLTCKDLMAYTGLSRNTVRAHFKFPIGGKYIAKTELARQVCS